MTRRVAKLFLLHLIEAAALVLALLAVGCGVVLWRLSTGPVDLSAFQDDLEAALAAALGGDVVSIGRAEAEWSPETRSLVIALSDVAVARADGGLIASAPRVEAGVSPLALLAGRIAFSQLALEGGAAHLERDVAGRVVFGVGAEPSAADADQARDDGPQIAGPISGDPLASLRAIIERPPGAVDALQSVRLHSGEMRLRDVPLGLEARLEVEELNLRRVDDGVTISGRGVLVANAQRATTILVGRLDLAAGTGVIDAEVSGVNLDALLTAGSPLRAVGEIDAPVRLALTAAVSSDAGIGAVELDVSLGAGTIRRAGVEYALSRARGRARFNPDDGSVGISDLTIASDILNASGAVTLGRRKPETGRWSLSLDLADVSLDLGRAFAAPLTALRFAGTGEIQPDAAWLGLDAFTLVVDGATATGGFSLRGGTQDDGRRRPDVTLDATVTGSIAARRILDYWPVRFIAGARDFLDAAILEGAVTGGRVLIDMTGAQMAAEDLDGAVLDVGFDFENGDVRFISTMSPILDGRGSGRLLNNSFGLTVETATLAGMDVTEGRVEMPRLVPKGARARYSAVLNGEATQVLRLLDEPPLELVTPYGVDPDAFEGRGSVSIVIERPMLSDPPLEDLTFTVSADMADVVAPTAHRSLRVTAEQVLIQADQAGLLAKTVGGRLGEAPAAIDWTETFNGEGPSSKVDVALEVDGSFFDAFGMPARAFFDGKAAVTIQTIGRGMQIASARIDADLANAELSLPGTSWGKRVGAPGTASFTVQETPDGGYLLNDMAAQTGDLSLRGKARIGPSGRLDEIALDRLAIGRVADMAVRLRRGLGDRLDVDVSGARIDARGAVAQLASGAGASALPAALRVSAQFDEAVVAEGVSLTGVSLDFEHTGARLARLNFSALGGEGAMEAEIAVAADAPAGPRLITATAPDAGLALSVLFGMDQIRGGALSVQGALPALNAPEDTPGDVVFTITDFTVVGAPTFAQILSLGSLRGLADALGGEGILFNRLEAPIRFSDGRYTLKEGRVSGPGLGLTVNGDVDLATQTLALEGVLVPAFGVNSMLGEIPVFGDLLVSRKGEGVFGLTYSVNGPFSGTRVFVNPLSALAPGVLRRIFEPLAAPSPPDAAGLEPAPQAPSVAAAPPEPQSPEPQSP